MINSVRNTVLSILNKNNYGYISPADFNLFAKQSQLDIFESYFHKINNQINKENSRMSGEGYADLGKGYREVIDTFYTETFLANSGGSIYTSPSQTYLLDEVVVFNTTITTGTTDGTTASKLVDSTAAFTTVKVGDIVVNTTDSTTAEVYAVDSATILSLSADVFTSGEDYIIYDSVEGVRSAEPVSNAIINRLNRSLLTAPSDLFPAYTLKGSDIRMYPNSITSFGQVKLQYIRTPNDPKWTYVTLAGGEPVFNQSANDYQDFELPLDDEPTLVRKILEYAGMSIREIQAIQFAQAKEQAEQMEEK